MARLGVAYLSMASSFSSSSFCRSITAMIMFLSSSVRWLRSGSSCMGGGTVGGRGPRGPTAEDMFVACPPPPLAPGLSHLSDSRPAAAPLLPPHSGALLAAAAGGGAAAAAAAEPGRARAQSFMVVCIHPAPDAAFVWVALARLGAARPPPATQPRPAGAGWLRRGGRGEGARARARLSRSRCRGLGARGGGGAGSRAGAAAAAAEAACRLGCLQFGAAGGRWRVWVSVRRSLGGFAPG